MELKLARQDDATSGIVELLRAYPESTRFFINSWTWGYEDVLKGISRAFNQEVKYYLTCCKLLLTNSEADSCRPLQARSVHQSLR